MVLPKTQRVRGREVVGNFSTANYYAGVDAADPPGGTGTTVPITVAAVVACKMPPPGATRQLIVGHDNANTRGWKFDWINTELRFIIADGGGVPIVVQLTPVLSPGLFIMLGAADASEARLRCLGTAPAPTAKAAGYTVPAAGRELVIGADSFVHTSPSTSFNVIAFLGSDSVALSAAELTAAETWLIDAVEQGRDDLSDVPVLGTQADLVYYDARDIASAPGISVTPWTCRQGNGVNLTRNGAPEAYFVPARFIG